MDNRRALVTGGASGFGLETARALLAQGAQVAVADINADALHAAALDGALPLEIDVTSSASVDRGVAAAVEAFGGLATLGEQQGRGPVLANISLGRQQALDNLVPASTLFELFGHPALKRRDHQPAAGVGGS